MVYWIKNLGGPRDPAHVGEVDNVTSLFSYVKQLVTRLLAQNNLRTFTVVKTVNKTAVTTAGVALTGQSSGSLNLVSATVQNDGNAADGATQGVFLQTNDATTPLNAGIVLLGNDLTAGKHVHVRVGYAMGSGKVVSVKAVGSNLSGNGVLTFHLVFRQETEGATISAS